MKLRSNSLSPDSEKDLMFLFFAINYQSKNLSNIVKNDMKDFFTLLNI